jgi:hypothetical protein
MLLYAVAEAKRRVRKKNLFFHAPRNFISTFTSLVSFIMILSNTLYLTLIALTT